MSVLDSACYGFLVQQLPTLLATITYQFLHLLHSNFGANLSLHHSPSTLIPCALCPACSSQLSNETKSICGEMPGMEGCSQCLPDYAANKTFSSCPVLLVYSALCYEVRVCLMRVPVRLESPGNMMSRGILPYRDVDRIHT